MPAAPDPAEIYGRAVEEGRRRLLMPPIEQVSTGFIAGVTIMFGIIALGMTTSLVEPELGHGIARVAGALGFGIGLVFLVVGRTELFSENFFDPVAATIDPDEQGSWVGLIRLWATMLILNLVGGAVVVAVVAVDGALPTSAERVLAEVAEDIAAKTALATLARAVLAGALITLLSYMLKAANATTARVLLAYMVGFFLAIGPFDHVIVSALHLMLGMVYGDTVDLGDLGTNVGLSTVGNMVGGLLLITLTHTAQVRSHS